MCLNKIFGKAISPLAKLSPVGAFGIADKLIGKKKKDKDRAPMPLPGGAQSLLQDQSLGRNYMRDIF